jgi:hypothetical protein
MVRMTFSATALYHTASLSITRSWTGFYWNFTKHDRWLYFQKRFLRDCITLEGIASCLKCQTARWWSSNDAISTAAAIWRRMVWINDSARYTRRLWKETAVTHFKSSAKSLELRKTTEIWVRIVDVQAEVRTGRFLITSHKGHRLGYLELLPANVKDMKRSRRIDF